MSNTKFSNGVSLIEALVTVVIISVIAGIAAPSFTKMIERNRLLSATEAIFYHINYAKSEAIKLNKDIHFTLMTGNTWCTNISDTTCNCNSTNCTYNNGALQSTLLSNEFKNVSINDASNTSTTSIDITVNGNNGTFGASNGTLTITSSPTNLKTKIIYSRLGRVRICSDDGIGGYTSC